MAKSHNHDPFPSMRVAARPGTRDRLAATFTRTSTTTYAQDLERQVPEVGDAVTAPATEALRIRGRATGRVATARPARRAVRQVNKTARRRQAHHDHVAKTKAAMSERKARSQVAEVNARDIHASRLGHLAAWISPMIVIAVMATMLANDPVFIVAVLRDAMDVPTSLPVTRLDNPAVLVSTAAGVAVSLVLLTCAVVGGRAIGSVLLSPDPKLDQDGRGTTFSARLLGQWQRIGIGLAAIAVLAFMMVRLHALAEYQFGQAQSVFGSATSVQLVSDHLVLIITWLPAIVLVFEAIASAPSFEHARRVTRWALVLKMWQRRSIRVEERLLRALRRREQKARRAMLNLLEVVDVTGERADNEYIQAAISTGRVSVDEQDEGASASVVATITPGSARALPGINRTGAPTSSYLRFPPASNCTAAALQAWTGLPAVPDTAELIQAWHDLRADPACFCAVETDEAEPRCVTVLNPNPSAENAA